MDEPLASLDESRKAEILPYIERLRDESRIPIVYVSHSIAEVSRLANTVVLMSEGRVAASGPTLEIMHRLDLVPLTGGAEAGAIIEAVVERHDAQYGLTELRSRAGLWKLPHLDAEVGARLRLRVHARDVMLARSAPDDLSALNIFAATVADIGADGGPMLEVRLDCGGDVLIARLTRYSAERLGLVPGVPVYALVKSVALDRRGLADPASSGDLRQGRLMGQRRLEGLDVCGGSRGCGMFDGTIAANHIMAERSEARAASARSAHLLFDQRFAEDSIDLVHEHPGPAIGHVHFLAGRRDRSVLGDQFHQRDLAGAEVSERAEINADGQAGPAKRTAVLGMCLRGRSPAARFRCLSHSIHCLCSIVCPPAGPGAVERYHATKRPGGVVRRRPSGASHTGEG
jgi:molybdopterin-binding protein